jgi:HEAT repeat protein
MKIVIVTLPLVLLLGAAVAPAAETVEMSLAWEAAETDQRADENYERGTERLDEGDWAGAIRAFDTVARGHNSRVDGALYWKAYAQHRAGQQAEALATLAALRSAHPASHWLNDAQALEVEVRQGSGQPVSPESQADDEIKLMALRGLMESDPARALPHVEKMLQNPSRKLRDRALFVLAHSDSPEAQRVLLQVAKGGRNPDLQRVAVRYLGAAGNPQGTAALREIYGASTDSRVRKAVLQAWMISGETDAVLQAARGEKDAEMRAEAVRQLGVMGARDAVRELYRADKEPEVRKAALQAMFVGGDAEHLLQVARNEADRELRRMAIRNLGLVGGNDSTALLSIYEAEKDPEIRQAVVQGLFVQGNARALVDLARKEKDPHAKRDIVQKLSHMDEPEARAYLIELLEK